MNRVVTLVAVAALAACAGAPPVARPPSPELRALDLAEFPAAARLLERFDERSDDATWLANDRALFGLQLDGGGESVRWLLLVELPLGQRVSGVWRADDGSERPRAGGATATWRFTLNDDAGSREVAIESRLASARARVFTADGELLTDTEDTLPVDLLGRGLVPAVERAHAAGAPIAPDRATLEGFLAVQRLLDIVRGNEALADYFWRVVEKPSLWSVVTHFGVEVSVALPLEQSVPARAPAPIPAAQPAWAVPLRIDVNGSPALFVDLIATDSRRPYALCGGIVAAIARHPTRPERTFRMQLLAARLGDAARATIHLDPPR